MRGTRCYHIAPIHRRLWSGMWYDKACSSETDPRSHVECFHPSCHVLTLDGEWTMVCFYFFFVFVWTRDPSFLSLWFFIYMWAITTSTWSCISGPWSERQKMSSPTRKRSSGQNKPVPPGSLQSISWFCCLSCHVIGFLWIRNAALFCQETLRRRMVTAIFIPWSRGNEGKKEDTPNWD